MHCICAMPVNFFNAVYFHVLMTVGNQQKLSLGARELPVNAICRSIQYVCSIVCIQYVCSIVCIQYVQYVCSIVCIQYVCSIVCIQYVLNMYSIKYGRTGFSYRELSHLT